jgi:nucleotide-binding universal stress UspA family protein
MTREIVVGYDGSPGSDRALRWAVEEAMVRGTVLTACLAWAPDPLAPQDEALARKQGEEILASGLRHAQARLGPERVRQVMARGLPVQVLRDRSATAEMLVVSCHAGGAPAEAPIGSVAWRLASSARGPVVVVRGPWRAPNRSPGPVVVGVDGSAACRAAIPFAFAEAALRDVPLLAVCATADAIGVLGGAHRLAETFDALMAEQEKEHPDVTVVRQVSPGPPRTALLTAAAGAQLVVVGPRGLGGVPGMSLGSVAHVVLLHAPCSVAIVHSS